MFLFNKIREQEGGTGSTQEVGCGVGGPQIMYTHVSKCKNGKVKIKKGKKKISGATEYLSSLKPAFHTRAVTKFLHWV
jgi:hypothetical protein